MEFNVTKTADLFEINGITSKLGNIFFGEPKTTVMDFKLTVKNITDKTLDNTDICVNVINMYDDKILQTENFEIKELKSKEVFGKEIDLSGIDFYGTFLITVKLTNGKDEVNDFFKVAHVMKAERQNDITGVNGHLADHFVGGYEQEMMEQSLDLAKAAGFKWIADDFLWELCEREKGVVDIPDYYEKYVNACKERNLDIQMNLKLNNRYYSPLFSDDPEYLAALSRVYGALAKKFKGKIGSWEAAGECDFACGYTYAEYPNNDGYTPEKFAVVMKNLYNAIKSEDPNTTVLYGSLLRNSYAWLHRFLRAGGGEYSDVVAIHPYTEPYSPYGDVTKWISSCTEISKKYNAKGTTVRISELGFSTSMDNEEKLGCSEIEQAAYSVQAYLVCKQAGNVEYVSYYDISNDGTGYEDLEHKFGLLDGRDKNYFRTPFMVKPAYAVMPVIANKLSEIEFQEEFYFDIWLVGLKFKTNDNRDLFAIWSKAGRDKHIELTTKGINGNISWFDMFGNEHFVDEDCESFGFDLSIAPMFVLADSITDEWCDQPQISLHRTNHVVKSTFHRPI